MNEDQHPEWVSLLEPGGYEPPFDVPVEVKGHRGDKIELAHFSSVWGDWIGIAGDPTHWRSIQPQQPK